MDYKQAQPRWPNCHPSLDYKPTSREPWSTGNEAPGICITYSTQTSFYINDDDDKGNLICYNLSLSDFEEFAIPTSTNEARKFRSSDLLPLPTPFQYYWSW